MRQCATRRWQSACSMRSKLVSGSWPFVSSRDDALTRACGMVGADLTKVGRHGAPSKRHVCLSEDGMQLVWLSKRKGGMQSSELQRPQPPTRPRHAPDRFRARCFGACGGCPTFQFPLQPSRVLLRGRRLPTSIASPNSSARQRRASRSGTGTRPWISCATQRSSSTRGSRACKTLLQVHAGRLGCALQPLLTLAHWSCVPSRIWALCRT